MKESCRIPSPPLTAHRWKMDDTYRKLVCTECGAGLSEEGVAMLALDLQVKLEREEK